jgi:hypothetical protein
MHGCQHHHFTRYLINVQTGRYAERECSRKELSGTGGEEEEERLWDEGEEE